MLSLLRTLIVVSSVTAVASAGDAAAAAVGLPRQLLFERNGGAYAESVAFVARGPALTLFACDDGVVVSLDGAASGGDGSGAFSAAVRTTFVDARADVDVVGTSPQRTRVHHLRGSDRGRWSSDNATFASVRYDQLWHGIDLLLYDAGGEVEYDFVVAPGVDPDRVRFRIEGADEIVVAQDGDLVITTAAGELRQSAPVVYQEALGGQEAPGGRELVPGRFVLHGDGEVGFSVGAYDRSRTLVIDPVLSYATYITGSDYVHVTDVAVDGAENAYVCGYTKSADLPTTSGVIQPGHAAASAEDAFVGKLSPDGRQILWLTYLGGSVPTGASNIAPDLALTIDVDGSGHVVVGGWTHSADFPLVDAFDVDIQLVNGFVSKLLPDGSGLVFSTYVGGGADGTGTQEAVRALDVDDAGNVWITGTYGGVEPIPATPGAFDATADPLGVHGYVMHLDATGAIVWATYLQGDLPWGSTPDLWQGIIPITMGVDIEVDSAGRVYVAGHTNTADFPLTNACDTVGPANPGEAELFLTRLAADGTALDYSTFLGGSDTEGYDRLGVACTDDGRAWIVGGTTSTDYPTTAGAFDTHCAGGNDWDGIVTCVDTDLAGVASLVFSTYYGQWPAERFNDVVVDGAGRAYIVGWTSSDAYPVKVPWQSDIDGAQNVVLTVLGPAGQPLRSTYYGRGGAMWADDAAIALGRSGDVYLAFTTNDERLATPGAAVTKPTPFSYSSMVTRWRMADPDCQRDLGFAGPGNAVLSMCGGDMSTGVFSKLVLESGQPFQTAYFFVGATNASTFVGGLGGTLVPGPALVIAPLVTDFFGEIEFLVPGGGGPFQVYGQFVLPDPGSPSGWALSNALEMEWKP